MDRKVAILNLKRKLAAEAAKEDSDINAILSLTSQIANLDDTNVRFSVDAGLIDRLGKELVARQETAVSELVKNSYDADAREVKITFSNSDVIGGSLTIQDDGDGMTREELLNGFMRISSTDKIHNPYSKTFKRRRAGQKGIGRFAVQRLGSNLTIVTQTENSDHALQLSIDWDEYKGDVNLISIANALKVVPKIREKGTTLFINNLREKWGERAISRIYNYVADILQPYRLSPESENEESERKTNHNDPGFRFEFVKITENKAKTIQNELLSFYTHALAVIEGYVNQNGAGIYTVESKRLGINEIGQISNDPENNTVPFDKLRNVKFRAYYFIYDSDLLPAMQMSSIKKLAQTQGGLRLYRNGFRVLPYGEPNNDWLSLDASLRTRSLLPSHGNNNFFGFVELIDKENTFFETSSREGLTENEAFVQLQNFVYRTLISGVIRVAVERNIKITPSQKKDAEGNYEEIEFKIRNIAHTIEELENEFEDERSGVEVKKRRKKKLVDLKKDIDEIQKLRKEEQERFIKEKSMLRVLSSVGLTIGQFIHEIKYYMDNIQSDIRFLSKQMNVNSFATERINILDSNFASFHTYTSYFDDVVSKNVVRDLVPLDMRNVVKPFVDSIKGDAIKSGITFITPVYHKYLVYTKPMHPSEWSSILFNFYTNSKKAIKRANVNGEIFIECGDEGDMIYLEFSDNGDGISKENEEKIFEEFFTTTSFRGLSDYNMNTEVIGTGLGLKIVRDIVSSYKGNVKVVSPKESYSTTIRIEVPKSTKKELEKHGL